MIQLDCSPNQDGFDAARFIGSTRQELLHDVALYRTLANAAQGSVVMNGALLTSTFYCHDGMFVMGPRLYVYIQTAFGADLVAGRAARLGVKYMSRGVVHTLHRYGLSAVMWQLPGWDSRLVEVMPDTLIQRLPLVSATGPIIDVQ